MVSQRKVCVNRLQKFFGKAGDKNVMEIVGRKTEGWVCFLFDDRRPDIVSYKVKVKVKAKVKAKQKNLNIG